LAIQPLKNESKSIWITCWKVDDWVHSNVLGLCNEKLFMNLEALPFGANSEFNNFRASITIETLVHF
jgi:hypothetical protein